MNQGAGPNQGAVQFQGETSREALEEQAIAEVAVEVIQSSYSEAVGARGCMKRLGHAWRLTRNYVVCIYSYALGIIR
jgi:hypothetical protein